MAFASYLHDGTPGVGRVDGDELVPVLGLAEMGTDTSTARLRSATFDEQGRIPLSAVELRPAVPSPGRIFCVGLNYRSHVEETNREMPTYPVLFPKYASSLIGPFDDIALPPESNQVDYEGELAVIIGTAGRRIAPERAHEHILGYAVANDVTMRDFQYKTHQWMQGKAWDDSTPLGPYLVTPEEADISAAGIRTVLNGRTVQESDLSLLIFSIPTLISTLSEFTRLQPGDIILTGTPSGVGFRRDPQVFLRAGDTVSVEIDGIGKITNNVTKEPIRSGS